MTKLLLCWLAVGHRKQQARNTGRIPSSVVSALDEDYLETLLDEAQLSDLDVLGNLNLIPDHHDYKRVLTLILLRPVEQVSLPTRATRVMY